jgi:hypothetical protein
VRQVALAGTITAPVASGTVGGIPLTSTIFANNQITGGISQPQLLFRYITPSPIEVLPGLMEYPYTQTVVYQTPVGAPSAGGFTPSVFGTVANQSITSNAIQFSTIPDQIMIYLFRQPSDRNHFTSDTFAAIQSVNINFMNQTGLLASATQKVRAVRAPSASANERDRTSTIFRSGAGTWARSTSGGS